ncbi:MAG: amidohydrolase family protein [Bacteroidales bacterium]
MSIYLKNATFIDWETFEFSNVDIEVGNGIDGKLTFFPPNSEMPTDTHSIDCTGKYVTKSLAVGHHHVYSALARGMPAPAKIPTNFPEILKYVWWNLDKNLDKDTIEASALATAIDCAKNGATFAIDHHASPNAVKGSLEIIAKAFDKVGVSHLLCYEISDRDGLDLAKQGIEESEEYLKKNQALVGLHASFTVGNTTMKMAVGLAEKYDTGIHMHVAEDTYDQHFCWEHYKTSVVGRLNEFGILSRSKSILVHCLHLDEQERRLLQNSPAWIVQNMESNLKNKVGFFDSKGLGNNIMLGTDGMHSDMIRSTKAAYFVGQNFDSINDKHAYNRLRNVHRYLSENNFKGDGENNLIVLDYQPPTNFHSGNFLGHFIFGWESKHIQHVISNGNLIVKDRKTTNVDEQETLAKVREMSLKLWQKLSAK